MKKFLCRFLLLLFSLIVTAIMLDAFSFTSLGNVIMGKLTYSTGYARMGSAEIIPKIEKVQKKDKTKKLIVGDSVCNQVFNDLQVKNPSYCIAASNASLSLAGQYLLIKEYVNSHEQIEEVDLFLLPRSFYSDNLYKNGFSYFIAAFFETNLMEELDKERYALIQSEYPYFAKNPSLIKLIDYSPVNQKIFLNYKFSNQEKRSDEECFWESDYYLHKISELCRKQNIKFKLFSGPIPDNKDKRDEVEQLCKYSRISADDELWSQYFESIVYEDSKMFPDGVHYGGKYKDRIYYNEYLEKISSELDGLSY